MRLTMTDCANCGHPAEVHVLLPGHPDGAQECYGSDDCECGQYRAPQTALRESE